MSGEDEGGSASDADASSTASVPNADAIPNHLSDIVGPPEQVLDDSRATVLVAAARGEVHRVAEQALGSTYRLAQTDTREVALAFARAYDPALVMICEEIGTVLPDGFTLCGRLRADPSTRHIPIVVLASDHSPERHLQAVLEGADEYFDVDVDPGVLWARAGRLVARGHVRGGRAGDGEFGRESANDPEMRPRLIDGCETPASTPFSDRVHEIIQKHLSDPDLTVEKIAKEVALSPSQLYRRVRRETGAGPNELIRTTRVERAAELLASTDTRISEVAYAVGFNNHSYFCRCFRDHYGTAPTAYREALRGAG